MNDLFKFTVGKFFFYSSVFEKTALPFSDTSKFCEYFCVSPHHHASQSEFRQNLNLEKTSSGITTLIIHYCLISFSIFHFEYSYTRFTLQLSSH
jgi:hypothetical protein